MRPLSPGEDTVRAQTKSTWEMLIMIRNSLIPFEEAGVEADASEVFEVEVADAEVEET